MTTVVAEILLRILLLVDRFIMELSITDVFCADERSLLSAIVVLHSLQ